MEAGVEKEEEDHPQRQWEKHALLLVPMTAAGADGGGTCRSHWLG